MAVELLKQTKFFHLMDLNQNKPNTQKHELNQESELNKSNTSNTSNTSFALVITALLVLAFACGVLVDDLPITNWRNLRTTKSSLETPDINMCYKTCRLSVVESVPENLTTMEHSLPSTFEAWHYLITNAKHSIDVAAYKSSLRGKHVLGTLHQDYSTQGDQIFEDLEDGGLNRNIHIRMLENGISKDKGDNMDGISLFEHGAIDRKTLNLQRIYHSGIMHSKFIITDDKDLYLGSANLDWRSLTQKLEMGVLVRDCPCLAKELKTVFEFYWKASDAKTKNEYETILSQVPPLSFNMKSPLRISYKNVDANVYIATSPKPINSDQTWDLTAIVHTIETAKSHLYIHVMDFFPMFVYSPNREYWPTIDNAIREAVLRGVHVKIISAALHYPRIGITFLKSLELINEVSRKGSIEIKIFKVPTPITMNKLLRRERRTHKKFMVSDDSVVIGNSNWSADYFESIGTGTAIIITQKSPGQQPFIDEMRSVFSRDWNSPHAHPLNEYYEGCLLSDKAAFCESEKDASFLANPSTSSSAL